MIFDENYIQSKVTEWREAGRPSHLLEDIIDGSTKLIEVIVSRFDNRYREDLIQECKLKLITVLDRIDPERGKMHSFLTSVFNNHCISYITRDTKTLELDGLNIEAGICEEVKVSIDILSLLLIRNRERFPSIPVTVVDDVTKYIYDATIHTVYGKSRGIMQGIVKYGLSRTVATALYHSTLYYMRLLLIKKCKNMKVQNPAELSILKDFKEIVGPTAYKTLSTLFSGMYIKFP